MAIYKKNICINICDNYYFYKIYLFNSFIFFLNKRFENRKNKI